jgi:predicted deacylase
VPDEELAIGPIAAGRGEKRSGFIQVAKSSAGLPIGIPLVVIRGTENGPTLVCGAAMHGTEVVGTMAISRIYRELSPKRLRGVYVGVPITNTWAFEARNRVATLFDELNMEWLFPGKENTTITPRLAHAYTNEVLLHADCFIDMHGQDSWWQPTKAVIVPKPMPDGEISRVLYQKCLRLSALLGAEQVWRLNKPGTATEILMKKKRIPALATEYGGVTRFEFTESYVSTLIRGVKSIMVSMGMLKGKTRANSAMSVLDVNPVYNRHGGIWRTERKYGKI